MRRGSCLTLLRYSRSLVHHNPWFQLARDVRWTSQSSFEGQWSTPLAKNLAKTIEVTGPISIASYMRQCLTSLDGGYYTSRNQGKDQFGQKGDFITSPEISQIFGELLGIWIVAEWMAQGKPSAGVELIEVGPGRGTLMDDMLRATPDRGDKWQADERGICIPICAAYLCFLVVDIAFTISNFKPLASSIDSIFLVEASPTLRQTQKRLLCGEQPLYEVEKGFKSTSKYLNLPITWSEDIRHVPSQAGKTPFIIAHEFFDALPIHAFQSIPPHPNSEPPTLETPTGSVILSKQSPQSKESQWRELVVTPISCSPITITTASPSTSRGDVRPEFQLSVAKASTSNSLVLPNISQRYKDLLATANSIIEISPESHSYAADFAHRIGGSASTTSPRSSASSSPQVPPHTDTTKSKPSGAALILDYGPKHTIPTSTLRGIRDHALTSPFSSPGLVDISADVDFTALAEAALGASEGVEVHGPVEQGYWLEQMGVKARADMICEALKSDEEAVKRVKKSVERLIERGGGAMGRIYKALAIVPERGGKRPVGFGGSLT